MKELQFLISCSYLNSWFNYKAKVHNLVTSNTYHKLWALKVTPLIYESDHPLLVGLLLRGRSPSVSGAKSWSWVRPLWKCACIWTLWRQNKYKTPPFLIQSANFHLNSHAIFGMYLIICKKKSSSTWCGYSAWLNRLIMNMLCPWYPRPPSRYSKHICVGEVITPSCVQILSVKKRTHHDHTYSGIQGPNGGIDLDAKQQWCCL